MMMRAISTICIVAAMALSLGSCDDTDQSHAERKPIKGEAAYTMSLAAACPDLSAAQRLKLYIDKSDEVAALAVYQSSNCIGFVKGTIGILEDKAWSDFGCFHVTGSNGCLWMWMAYLLASSTD